MENLEIYNKYKEVPKEALKPFDNGKFKGTDINTMWRIKCLTEQFGVCGIGWTVRPLRLWTEQGANEEVLAFAELELKVKLDGEWSEPIIATGGNKMVKFNKKYESLENSDEAFKMALTDAFGVCCKYLGIGASVYFENDTSKYTADENALFTKLEEARNIMVNDKLCLGQLNKEQLIRASKNGATDEIKKASQFILDNDKEIK